MTRTVLHTAVSAAAALSFAICFSGSSFAADGDNSTKQIKTLKFAAPKAPVAQFVTPKAPVAQFVPPKSGRTGSGLGSNGGSPTTVFRLTPKAPVAGSSSGSATTTAQFVAPKANKTARAARSRPNSSRRRPRRSSRRSSPRSTPPPSLCCSRPPPLRRRLRLTRAPRLLSRWQRQFR
jgi:hypothetical protein